MVSVPETGPHKVTLVWGNRSLEQDGRSLSGWWGVPPLQGSQQQHLQLDQCHRNVCSQKIWLLRLSAFKSPMNPGMDQLSPKSHLQDPESWTWQWSLLSTSGPREEGRNVRNHHKTSLSLQPTVICNPSWPTSKET
ncbi:uncharacterized protein LJ206_011466 isoform 1-T1 [Theristicus caerulescens]